jgi:hypothetical protein
MRSLMSLLLVVMATAAHAQEYRLPFEGRWFVMQGGDTPNVNQHMSLRAQWYGIDFARVGGPSGRQLTRGEGSSVEDFYSWGEPVLSPAAGEVVAVVDSLPDNPLGKKDPEHPAGNHVVLKVGADRYVFLAHMQRGQRLGLCGNSGNSDFPHIHMHVQDSPELNVGKGQNLVFAGIDVELSGKQFSNVTWPLIRGLFVQNR